jgi:type II secretory pathway pseudopilin PulG
MEAIAAEVARMTSRRVEELRAEAEKITALAAQIEAAALGNKSGKVTPQRIVIGGRTGLATHLATIPGAPNPIDVSPGAPGPLAVDVKGTPDEAVTGVTGVVDPTPKPEPAAASRQGQGTVSGGAR